MVIFHSYVSLPEGKNSGSKQQLPAFDQDDACDLTCSYDFLLAFALDRALLVPRPCEFRCIFAGFYPTSNMFNHSSQQ